MRYIFCRWAVSPWRPCTKTCGRGLQYRSVRCMRQTRNGTTKESPSHLCPSDKPSGVQNCIKKACHLNWVVSPWSHVSHTGNKVFRALSIECRKIKTNVITTVNQKIDLNITKSQSELKVIHVNDLKRGKTRATKSRLVLVLHLIG